MILEYAAGETDSASDSSPEPSSRPRYIPLAKLLERVLGKDVLRCPNCGGRRHMISVVTDPASVRKVLEGIKLAAAKRRLRGIIWQWQWQWRGSGECRGAEPCSARESRIPHSDAAAPRMAGLRRVGEAVEGGRRQGLGSA